MEDSVSFAPNASGKKSRYRKLEGKISDLSKRIRDNDKILDYILCERVSESVKQTRCRVNVNDVKPYMNP